MASSSSAAQNDEFELYLIWSNQAGDRLPHWMLMTVPRLTNNQRLGVERTVIKGTRYHSTGGPTTGQQYRVAVQANSNFRSESIRSREFICSMSARNVAKLAKLANEIPPHQCQKYVVCMLALMEHRGMIPRGIAERLASRVAMGRSAANYEASHPAPVPVGIRLPPSWPMPPSGASGPGQQSLGIGQAAASSSNAGRGQQPGPRNHGIAPAPAPSGNHSHGQRRGDVPMATMGGRHPAQRQPQAPTSTAGGHGSHGSPKKNSGCCIIM